MSPTNSISDEKTACVNCAVLKTYLRSSPDSLGRKFVDGNQEFLKLFREDHISKWFPAAIHHYERDQGPCSFIEINDDFPVDQVACRKNPSEGLWTVGAKSPSENALSLLPGNVLEVLKSNIKEVQDDEDTGMRLSLRYPRTA